MTRGFQSWYQNSNRITFDPRSAEKQSIIGKIPDLANFRIFLALNVVKCYLIWILMPDLESSHHLVLVSLRTPVVIIFNFWNFWPPMLLLDPKCKRGPPNFFEKIEILMILSWSALKTASDKGWDWAFSKSCTNRTTLMYSPSVPLMLTYIPKHENFKADVADLDIYRFR